MIRQKELLPVTGYVHGGCSPIGMKKHFPTFIHETAAGFDKVFVSLKESRISDRAGAGGPSQCDRMHDSGYRVGA